MADSILADDHEGAANSHQAMQAAHQQMTDFVDHWHGQIISSGGEDGILAFEVNDTEMFLQDLENLQQHLQELSGTQMTIGVGERLSEAGKAFLYAKMTESPEVTIYDEGMEQEIDQAGGEAEEMPEEEGSFYDEDADQEEDGAATEPEFEYEEDGIDDEGNTDHFNPPSDENEVGTPDFEEEQGEPNPEESENGDFSDSPEVHEDDREPVDQIDYVDEDGTEEQYKPFLDGEKANTSNVAIAGDEQDATNNDIGKQAYHPSPELDAGAP